MRGVAARVGNLVLHVAPETGPIGPGAPTLALVHSLGTDARLWGPLLARLPNVRAFRHDLRGHGLSARAPGTIADHADDLAALLERHAPERAVVVVGVSVGGLVAQSLAARHPERVRALVLSNTGLRIGTAERWAGRIEAVERDGLGALGEEIVAGWLARDYRRAHPAETALWRTLLERQDPRGYTDLCRAIAAAELAGSAGSIAVPCLCLGGDEDVSTPPATLETLARAIPGARAEILEGSAHLPMIDAVDRFATRLAGFLAELER